MLMKGSIRPVTFFVAPLKNKQHHKDDRIEWISAGKRHPMIQGQEKFYKLLQWVGRLFISVVYISTIETIVKVYKKYVFAIFVNIKSTLTDCSRGLS